MWNMAMPTFMVSGVKVLYGALRSLDMLWQQIFLDPWQLIFQGKSAHFLQQPSSVCGVHRIFIYWTWVVFVVLAGMH